jgi:hypothetical protein
MAPDEPPPLLGVDPMHLALAQEILNLPDEERETQAI